MLWDGEDGGWCMGIIKKYFPTAKTKNVEVVWDTEKDPRPSKLALET